MKKLKFTLITLFITLISFSQDAAKDPVIMTINGLPVYQSEFLYIYTKNNACVSYKQEDLDAYMEMFINYKLKVKEAERLGYDTIPKLVAELSQYRGQLSLPYMIDKEKNEALIKEAYDRTANEIRASHILIRLKPDALPSDTLIAYNKLMAFRERILGGETFEAVAKGNRSQPGSEDPSVASNGGDLGYFTALQMVYPFEEAAFTTPVGGLSMPIRTSFGYHIIKVTDKRASAGKMEASHIMILTSENMSPEDKAKAESKIKEIYDLLLKGGDFVDLAAKYSDDQSSKSKGGKLPEFGAGTKQRMVPVFEENAFAIKHDGEFCAPFLSPYGWHIIKRHKVTPVGTYEEMYRELKLKVERDVRAEKTKKAFINSLKTEYGYKDDANRLLPEFYNSMGSEIFQGNWKGLKHGPFHHDVLFSFKDKSFLFEDFELYLIETQSPVRAENTELFARMKFEEYVQSELLKYEDSQLETKYPEFKSLMQEYRDGILVFEVMQNEIWNKASKDSVGIKNYYEAHQTEFVYPIRYKGELYKCKDKTTADQVIAYLNSDTMDYSKIQMAINKDSELNLMIKRNTFNSETTEAFKLSKETKTTETTDAEPCKKKKPAKAPKYRKFKAGLNKTFIYKNEYYVFFVEEVMTPRQREFSEAKGLVTAAYQNHLEIEWLKNLRTTYQVVVNKDVLYRLAE